MHVTPSDLHLQTANLTVFCFIELNSGIKEGEPNREGNCDADKQKGRR